MNSSLECSESTDGVQFTSSNAKLVSAPEEFILGVSVINKTYHIAFEGLVFGHWVFLVSCCYNTHGTC